MNNLVALLRANFVYDPETGEIARKDGSRAFGCRSSGGYLQGKWRGLNLKAHRVAWMIAVGEIDDVIDHINGDCSDNRLVNLRAVSRATNQKNRAVGRNNKTGEIGVTWRANVGRWRVQVTIDGRRRDVGAFERFEDAVRCRDEAYAKAGYHANHGRMAND